MFRSHLLPSQHRNLVKLVGEKCQVKCKINGVETKALLDSGSQVAGLSEEWLSKNCPDAKIRDVKELLGEELDLRTANQQTLPYKGWVELSYQLGSGPVVPVPFLIVGDEVRVPIVGFNVMKRLLEVMGPVEFIQEMIDSLGLDEERATAAVKIIEAADSESLADVRSGKKRVVVSAGQMIKLKCRAPVGYLESDTPVLFQPDELEEWPEELKVNDKLLMLRKGVCNKVTISVVNSSQHDVVLPGSTMMGRLELVSSVTPVEVQRKEVRVEEEMSDSCSDSGDSGSCSDNDDDESSSCSGLHQVSTNVNSVECGKRALSSVREVEAGDKVKTSGLGLRAQSSVGRALKGEVVEAGDKVNMSSLELRSLSSEGRAQLEGEAESGDNVNRSSSSVMRPQLKFRNGEAENSDVKSSIPVMRPQLKVEEGEKFDPDVSFGPAITDEQKEKVRKLLREECESFMRDEDDVNLIDGLVLKMNMNDETPVQKQYNRVPKPLYPEVKAYIEDLLNRNWIRPSSSSYASPVVIVRKKDGAMRLCIDYRELNRRTVPDKYPLPRIQEMLDNLHGMEWFSTLDLGKAYHQGIVSEESQHQQLSYLGSGCSNGLEFLLG